MIYTSSKLFQYNISVLQIYQIHKLLKLLSLFTILLALLKLEHRVISSKMSRAFEFTNFSVVEKVKHFTKIFHFNDKHQQIWQPLQSISEGGFGSFRQKTLCLSGIGILPAATRSAALLLVQSKHTHIRTPSALKSTFQ